MEKIFDHLDKLYPLRGSTKDAKKAWARDVESFVQAHTEDVLSSPLFLRASISAVQHILSLPSLASPEDFVLSRVIQYAVDAAHVQTAAPALWTAEEREIVLPILLQLFPFIRMLSVSTKQFVLSIEPMKILSTEDLIRKYKFDAIARQLGAEGGRNPESYSLGTIKRFYKDVSTRREILEQGLRGSVAVAESAHPYYEGELEVLEEVSVVPWAPRVVVEFDRRTNIGLGGRLAFYKDANGQQLIGTWHGMWPSNRHGVKSFIVDSHKFYVGFSSCFFDDLVSWGWKIFVKPLFRPEDFV